MKEESRIIVNIKIPIKTVSEANRGGEHWTKKHKRHKAQKYAINIFFASKLDETCLPCIITLTRIAPRFLDDDNLQFSLKHIRDYTCDLIIRGKQMGRADANNRIQVKYEQIKGDAKEYAINVKVERL